MSRGASQCAACLMVSLSTGHALPRDLQARLRRHRHIEKQEEAARIDGADPITVHHVRDVTFREDLHQAPTGNGPAVIAALCNTAIGWRRTTGATDIAPPATPTT